jgi:pyruvate kinase
MISRLSDLSRHVATFLPAHGLARSGDLVAIIGGHPLTTRGLSNIVKILAIP